MATRRKAKAKAKAKRKKTKVTKTAARPKVATKKAAAARKRPVKKAPAKRASSTTAKPAAKVAVKPTRPRPPAPPAAASPAPAAPAQPASREERVGVVTHYFSHLSVATVRLESGRLHLGDVIRVRGHTTDFTQRVESLEVNHAPTTDVGPNDDFGLKVVEHAREHDVVYKVL
jgi:Elongation factor Tu domain 2